jgi:outer membrane protein, multidrug efflux system
VSVPTTSPNPNRNRNRNRNRNPNPNRREEIRIRITIRKLSRERGRFRFDLLPAVILVIMLAGCAVGPNYKRPDVNPPATFRDAEGATNSLGDLPWWQLFQDPVLKGLIQTALTNNFDIRIAAARVEQSRELLAQTRSAFYPQIGYEAGVGGGKNIVGTTPQPSGQPAGKE